jgi:hypothetical protein
LVSKVDDDQNLATDGDRPSVFGLPFDGPMEGHNAFMPRHYDLHVWIWHHNPSGHVLDVELEAGLLIE